MEISNLLKIHKNLVLVVADNSWNFLFGIVNKFYIFIHNSLQILPELFFRFNQFTDNGSENFLTNFIFTLNLIFINLTLVYKLHRQLFRHKLIAPCAECRECLLAPSPPVHFPFHQRDEPSI